MLRKYQYIHEKLCKSENDVKEFLFNYLGFVINSHSKNSEAQNGMKRKVGLLPSYVPQPHPHLRGDLKL